MSTTQASDIFDKMGVSEIGRKCLFTSRKGFCFGTGTTYACFHVDGKHPSRYEYFKMSDTGPGNMSACSFNNHPGVLFGPLALHGFNFDSFLRTDSTDTTKEFSE